MEHDYPHLHPPRPMPKVVGAADDARWRGVPKSVKRIDRLDVLEMQIRSRELPEGGTRTGRFSFKNLDN
jgi:hypothetical protein